MASEARFCHIEIETSAAHSFRMRPLSSDWKAPIMKQRMWVRIITDEEVSRLMERTRRKKEENLWGSSVKVPVLVRVGNQVLWNPYSMLEAFP